MSIWKSEKDSIDNDFRRAKADKERAKADKEKAKAERYTAQTKIREKRGGAGMEITFYDLEVCGRKVRIPRRRKDGKMED